MTTNPAPGTDAIATLAAALDRFLEAARRDARRRVLSPIERRCTKALQRAFRRQGRAFVQRLEGLRERWPLREADMPWGWEWESLFDDAAEETFGDFAAPVQRAAGDALTAGALRALKNIRVGLDLSFDLQNPRAVSYLAEHGAQLVAGVNETTKERIRTLLAEALDGGWSYDQMAEALLDRFDQFAVGRPQLHIDSRAHGIAVTEIGNAYVEGNAIVARDLEDAGLEMEKAWSTMGDERVSDACRQNQAQGWIAMSHLFQSGHAQPLAHPYCRCDLLLRRKGSE